MKKFLLIFIILIFSLALAILFNPRSAEGTTVMLRLDAEDIKEVVYKMTQKTVTLELHREINDITRLNFINFNKLEALLLMDMLTSHKGVTLKVDPDTGYVYNFGFSYKARVGSN